MLTLNSLLFFSQGMNVGTTYLRNDRYLISFDKVLYPGYNLFIENIQKREYLLGKLNSDTTFKVKIPVYKMESENSIKYTFEEDFASYICLKLYQENMSENCDFWISFKINFSNNKIISEKYSAPNNFEIFSSSTFTKKRTSKDNSKVDILSVRNEIDYEKNNIVEIETLLESRNLTNREIADNEGNVYSITTIGEQTWMAENLRATKFTDGTQIPTITEVQWSNSSAPGIVMKNSEGNFYNFHTLVAEKNVCPQGYHVPKSEDIVKLYNFIKPPTHQDKLKYSRGLIKVIEKKDSYEKKKYECSFGSYSYQPLITLLLNKVNDEFADQYGFNLNQDNNITAPNNKNTIKGLNFEKTGITYIYGNQLPGFFGIEKGSSSKKGRSKGSNNFHEHNLLENFYLESEIETLLGMQTRVRCVKD
jgi:uncharacterized protein (TIGR02145 family)